MPISMLRPAVLVENKNGSYGSGTVIFSARISSTVVQEKEGVVKKIRRQIPHRYVLTNLHVVEDSILFCYRKKRAHALGRTKSAHEKWTVRRLPLTVTAFEFGADIRSLKKTKYTADIVACDKEHDLALLRLRTGSNLNHVAHLAPRESALELLRPVWAVGCPLEVNPFLTDGRIGGTDEGGRTMRMLSSNPIYSGNSGGPLYIFSEERKRHEVIGVVTSVGHDANAPVSHTAYSIPIKKVWDFLEKSGYGFITKQKTEKIAE